MKRMMIILVVLLAFTTVSFAGGYAYWMTKKEVVAMLGDPASRDVHGAYERWEYSFAGNITDVLEFKNGRLTSVVRWATDEKGQKLRILDILVSGL